MPLPTPNSGEKESDFISRCIPLTLESEDLSGEDEADRKQATAICYSQWRKARESEAEQTEVSMPFEEIGQLAKGAIEIALAVVNDSGEITRDRANKVLRKWEADLEGLQGQGVPVAESASFVIDGQSVSLDELREAYCKLHEATMKTVDGKQYPASDFLVVEDPESPDSWHLQVKRNGKPDHGLMGGAKAALTSPGGHRGNKYEGPDKQKAITKLKTLYKSEDMEWTAGESATAEYEIAGTTIREVLMYLLDMWQDAQTPEEQAEAEMESGGLAVEVARDATAEDTATLSEAEAASIEAGRRAPVVIDFQVLTPGPGNRRDNHYYPADVVRRDIHVFEGVDVFATDHQEKERSERTKVGKVLSCPARFTEADAPVAQVLIYDPNQAEKTRNRADAGALDTLECSIFGSGRAKKSEIDGKEYKIVEALTKGIYFELVSKAGAGGKALNLAESEPGGEGMKDKKEAEAAPVEEVEIEEADADEPKKLEVEVVKEAVGKTNLPEFAKNALLAREYATGDELKEAVDEAVAEVKKLTGSGQVTGLGESEAAEDKPPSERNRILRFNEIMAEVGLAPVPVPDEEATK